MSKHLVTLIYGKVVGKASDDESGNSAAMRKAVLIAMADRANDDGSGVYVSKTRIAAELECSRTTVWSVAKELEGEGLIHAVGKKAGRRGATTIYQISVRNVRLLPDSWGSCSDLNTLDDALGEDEEPSATLTQSNEKASSRRTQSGSKAFNEGRHSVQITDTTRPYRTNKKHARTYAREDGPAADRRDASSSGPPVDYRRMAGDPEYARDHRDLAVEESPRGRLAELREELASLERTQANYAVLSDDDYVARHERLAAEIQSLENSEN